MNGDDPGRLAPRLVRDADLLADDAHRTFYLMAREPPLGLALGRAAFDPAVASASGGWPFSR